MSASTTITSALQQDRDTVFNAVEHVTQVQANRRLSRTERLVFKPVFATYLRVRRDPLAIVTRDELHWATVALTIELEAAPCAR